MSELRDLYQEVILDHNKQPRNRRKPAGSNREAHGHNPLCGDKVTVYLQLKDGKIMDVGFEGSGCAISTASVSMMTESVKGKSMDEVERLFHDFHQLVTEDHPKDADSLGKLQVFSGVREFPMRVKCATLAWHTLHAAIEEKKDSVTTE